MSDTPMPSASKLFLLVSASVLLAGCQALAGYAYDLAADEQRRQCEAMTSQAERRACLARVDKAEQQAEEARRKR